MMTRAAMAALLSALVIGLVSDLSAQRAGGKRWL